jgi:hypothetical protein
MAYLGRLAYRKAIRRFAGVAVVLVLATACTTQKQSSSIPAELPAVPTQTVAEPGAKYTPAIPRPADTPVPTDARLTPLSEPTLTMQTPVEQAIHDLASRLGVSQTSISVVRTYSDEFPASNLGCPEGKPNSRPIPALVSVSVIELEYETQIYIYHADRSQSIFCGAK